MIAKAIPFVAATLLLTATPLRGQEAVCDLFLNLGGSDGRQLVVTGDLIISKDVAVLGAADCDYRYVGRLEVGSKILHRWPVALSLHPSARVTPEQLRQFQDAGSEADRLRLAGKTVRASGSFSGRLRIQASGGSPAQLTFDSFDNLKVEALTDPSTPPVIPICELFQNLPAWRGKRIAVRGDFVSTMEGRWISAPCEGAFVTNGYRWPVSLSYAIPAYYSSNTAKLYEPQWPAQPKGKEVLDDSYAPTTTATFVGLLRMRSEYTTRELSNGRVVGNGFGHLNGAAAELIVEAILSPQSHRSTTTQKAITPSKKLYCEVAQAATLSINS